MSGEEERHLELFLQHPDVLPHRGPCLDVEAQGGLVQEEQLRVVDEAAGELEPPPHPPRVGLHLAVRRVLELDELQELLGVRLRVAPRQAVEVCAEQDVLVTGHVLVRGVLLRDDAHVPPDVGRLRADVETADRGLAGGRPHHRREDVDGRALTRAVGPQEPEDFALLDLEAHVVDGLELAEALRDPVDLDDRVGSVAVSALCCSAIIRSTTSSSSSAAWAKRAWAFRSFSWP